VSTLAPTPPTVPIPAEMSALLDSHKLEAYRVLPIVETFAPLFIHAAQVLPQSRGIEVTHSSQVGAMQAAREARLTLKKIRTTVENARKACKEESLRTGRLIDGVAALIVNKITPEEDRLQHAEDFAKREEDAKREEMIRQRAAAISAVDGNPAHYRLADLSPEQFSELLNDLRRKAEEAAAARAEAARMAAEAAKAEEENRAKYAAERERMEREVAEARAARAKAEAEAADLRRAREAAEAAERAKREAEEKETARIAQEKAAEAARAAAAPDWQRVAEYAKALDAVAAPEVSDPIAADAVKVMRDQMKSLAWIAEGWLNPVK